jgi:hypothetical protein
MPLGFHVQVNDDMPIRAGDNAISILSAIISYVASRNETELTVGDRSRFITTTGKGHARPTRAQRVVGAQRRTLCDAELSTHNSERDGRMGAGRDHAGA